MEHITESKPAYILLEQTVYDKTEIANRAALHHRDLIFRDMMNEIYKPENLPLIYTRLKIYYLSVCL